MRALDQPRNKLDIKAVIVNLTDFETFEVGEVALLCKMVVKKDVCIVILGAADDEFWSTMGWQETESKLGNYGRTGI